MGRSKSIAPPILGELYIFSEGLGIDEWIYESSTLSTNRMLGYIPTDIPFSIVDKKIYPVGKKRAETWYAYKIVLATDNHHPSGGWIFITELEKALFQKVKIKR